MWGGGGGGGACVCVLGGGGRMCAWVGVFTSVGVCMIIYMNAYTHNLAESVKGYVTRLGRADTRAGPNARPPVISRQLPTVTSPSHRATITGGRLIICA